MKEEGEEKEDRWKILKRFVESLAGRDNRSEHPETLVDGAQMLRTVQYCQVAPKC